MTTSEFYYPTRRIDRIPRGEDLEIEDTNVIIYNGIGRDAEVRFTGPKTVATIGGSISRGARVVVESPCAFIDIQGSLKPGSSFTMNAGKLDIYGNICRRAKLITDGECQIGGRISKLAHIGTHASVEVVDDVDTIQRVAENGDYVNPDLPPAAQLFFSQDGPGIMPDRIAEILFHDRFRDL